MSETPEWVLEKIREASKNAYKGLNLNGVGKAEKLD